MRSELARRWCAALSGLVIRHHDPAVRVEVAITDEELPQLSLTVFNCVDTSVPHEKRLESLAISTVRLTHWPGEDLAGIWMAVAWAGYLQHEALEMVSTAGVRCLDPHAARDAPHRLRPYAVDRGLRDGLPVELTPDSLRRALETAMDPDVADWIIARARENPAAGLPGRG
jgi:hypothetical protein